jgi:Bacterial PH domain
VSDQTSPADPAPTEATHAEPAVADSTGAEPTVAESTDAEPAVAEPQAAARPLRLPSRLVFRVPGSALVAVLFLVLCASPLAVAAPWLALVYVIPLGMAVWLLRTRTVVDTENLVIRRVLTRTVLPWSAIASLRVTDRKWVRAVRTDGGEVVLPTVRTRHLPALALMSGGRLPDPTG